MLTRLRSRSDLVGSLYFDLQSGPMNGKCWGPESVYFADHAWTEFIEPSAEKFLAGYHHHGYSTNDGDRWNLALQDLCNLRTRLARVDIPELVHVEVPELSAGVLHRQVMRFPDEPSHVVATLDEFDEW